MTKAAKFGNLTPSDVLQAMTPGEQYTLHQITQHSGVGLSSTRALLAGLIAEGSIRTGLARQRTVYWRPSEEELRRERQSSEGQQSRAVLTGYDASLRRLQELSMLARPRQTESRIPEQRVTPTTRSSSRRKAGKSDGS